MSAKDEALRILGYADKTEKELAAQLEKKGYSRLEIEQALNEIKEAGLANDRAYCVHFVEKSMEKGWGRRRIIMALTEKGILESLAEEVVFSEYPHEVERELAETEIKKIIGKNPDDFSASLAEKAARRLAYLGFEEETIESLLSRHMHNMQD